MLISKMNKVLDLLLPADIPLRMIGGHGIGKTQVVTAYGKRHGHHVFVFNTSSASDPADITGLFNEEIDQHGNKVATTQLPPKWLKEVIDFAEKNPDKYSIIFLDEFHRGKEYIISMLFSLASEKRIHEYKLPKNVRVIIADNPDTDNYEVASFEDGANVSRYLQLKVETSQKCFLEYKKQKGTDAMWMTFYKQHPEVFNNELKDFSLSDLVGPDNRSKEKVERLVKVYKDMEMNDKPLLKELIGGQCGWDYAEKLMSFIEAGESIILPEDILKSFTKNKARIENLIKSDRKDIIFQTNEQLIKSMLENTPSKTGINNFVKYFLMLSEEEKITLWGNVYDNDGVPSELIDAIDQNKTIVDYINSVREGKNE